MSKMRLVIKANLINWSLPIMALLLLVFVVLQNPGQRSASQDISFSQLLNDVDQGKVRDVVIRGSEIQGTDAGGRRFSTYAPSAPTLVDRPFRKQVTITARPLEDDVSRLVSLLVS